MKIALFSLATIFLWNAILTPLFQLPAIGFWQALGLLILSRLLAGGIGSHALMFRGHGRGWDFRNQMRERWNEMKPTQEL
ncbi:MAG: hypothetical protein LBT05_01195 [Planctomycetaceae bacterium]|jgi:hypothetical protein|nr:hypothetical protein [Planctomycetaceae bacterium]